MVPKGRNGVGTRSLVRAKKFAGRQESVVVIGINVDALFPKRLGEHRERNQLPVGVALVAERIADHADVVGAAQADVRERADLIHDRLEQGFVVVEDRHQPLGTESQRALVRRAKLAFANTGCSRESGHR